MMALYRIREPFWQYQAVGLAEDKMTSEILAVDVLYKDKDGNRKWPCRMYVSRSFAMACPQRRIKKTGPMVRIVPLEYLKTEVPA
jgi:hypothetical protein